ELDAVIRGQAADVELVDLLGPKIARKAGDGRLVVVAEGGIAVDRRIFTLLLDIVDLVDLEVGMELRVAGALDAVVGPQHLRPTAEFAHLEGFFTGMLRSEAAVAFGMPVLRG